MQHRKTQKINVAIIGVGNCASSLIQGIYYYGGMNTPEPAGLMHESLGGYRCGDVKIVAAFDIDERKVGRDVAEAIFAPPNCTAVFCADIPKMGVAVQMGPILDGYSDHMASYPDERRFMPLAASEPTKAEVVAALREADVDVVMNYLPVGSQKVSVVE